MTNENKETLEPTLNKPKRLRYDVGYCKPPKNSWFLTGISGNPKGRPKGSKNRVKDTKLSEILREELFCETEAELRGKKETVSIVRMVTQMLIDSALDGNFRAQQWVISASSAVEAADDAEQEADYQYAKAYVEEWGGQFFRDETLELIPNPDQIFLDHRHRRALFRGPRNADEKAEFEGIAAELAQKSVTEGSEAEEPREAEFVEQEKTSRPDPLSRDALTTSDLSTEVIDSDEEMLAKPISGRLGMDFERDERSIRGEL